MMCATDKQMQKLISILSPPKFMVTATYKKDGRIREISSKILESVLEYEQYEELVKNKILETDFCKYEIKEQHK